MLNISMMGRLLVPGYYCLGVLTVHIGSSGVWTQHTLKLLLRVCRENAERMMVVVRFRCYSTQISCKYYRAKYSCHAAINCETY